MITRGKELNPVTRESAAAAELFNDKVDELTRQFNTFKVEAGNKIIPVLAEIGGGNGQCSAAKRYFAGVLAGLKSAVTQVASSGSFGQGILGPLGYLAAREKSAQKDIEEQARETAEALDEIKPGH